jgi:hypothetical protein
MLATLGKRFFSAAAAAGKPHVWVNRNTKVICQGITGKQVRNFHFGAQKVTVCLIA